MLASGPEPAFLARWSRRLGCLLSLFFLLLFLDVALHRLRYPVELDRMESGMMTSVWRLAHGHTLYSAPSMEWVPFLYAPLFFYLALACSHWVGLGYAALRLVSVVSACGSFGLISLFVWRETRRHSAALVAAGLFACLYEFCAGWFDVGRVDSLSVFLFLAALYATRWMNPIVAALLWVLAFHSKQTFLPFGVLAFVPLWGAPRRMIAGMATFCLVAGGSALELNRATGGWYGHYVFGTVGELGFSVRQAMLFLPLDVVRPLPIVVTLLLAAAIFDPPRWRLSGASFHLFITVLLVGATGFVRGHVGANINAVIPLYAWMAVLAGLAIHRILTWVERPENGLSLSQRQLAASVLWLAISAQMLSHLYQMGHFIPQPRDLVDRNALLDAIRATRGDVWLVNHSYDGVLAGKGVHAEMDALDAVLGLPDPAVVAQFNRLIEERHFAAILMDRPPSSYAPEGIFTGSAFRSAYGTRLAAPGSDGIRTMDQPLYMYLPCIAPPPKDAQDL